MKSSMTLGLLLLYLAAPVISSQGGPLLDPTNSILVTEPEQKQTSQRHKVHNLVLNPDKHSWCKLKHIRQIVTHAHCTSQEMENYVCVGACFSYSVPQTEPETPGDELLDHCDSCSASESYWTTVTLDCDRDGLQYKVRKNIQLIHNCSCSACKPPMRRNPISNEVFPHQSEYRISDIIHKILPDSHKFTENNNDKKDKTPVVDNPPTTKVSPKVVTPTPNIKPRVSTTPKIDITSSLPIMVDDLAINSSNTDNRSNYDNNRYDVLTNEIDIFVNGNEKVDLNDNMKYSQISLGDLKKEFNLDDKQEQLLHGKLLIKDKASFRDSENEDDGEFISY